MKQRVIKKCTIVIIHRMKHDNSLQIQQFPRITAISMLLHDSSPYVFGGKPVLTDEKNRIILPGNQ
jgi:hypothetical protein